jgi:hypothetical protein
MTIKFTTGRRYMSGLSGRILLESGSLNRDKENSIIYSSLSELCETTVLMADFLNVSNVLATPE